jgi:SAM-dependent methyltransferase
VDLDADLKAYYDAEARGGHRRPHGERRHRLRRGFAALLLGERRRRLVDVGAGPGLDTSAWQTDGFDVVGVDLAHANVAIMRERQLSGVTGSLYHLPFRDGAFDALWTMSTFVHVPHERFDDAMCELLRVVSAGAPLGIGTWGGVDFEGVPEFGELRPHRFFSLASHERWQAMLAGHGELERFETFGSTGDDGWEYQFGVVRAPG